MVGEIQEGMRGLSVCSGLLQEGRCAQRCNDNYELRMRTARCGERIAHGASNEAVEGKIMEVEAPWKWKYYGSGSWMEKVA